MDPTDLSWLFSGMGGMPQPMVPDTAMPQPPIPPAQGFGDVAPLPQEQPPLIRPGSPMDMLLKAITPGAAGAPASALPVTPQPAGIPQPPALPPVPNMTLPPATPPAASSPTGALTQGYGGDVPGLGSFGAGAPSEPYRSEPFKPQTAGEALAGPAAGGVPLPAPRPAGAPGASPASPSGSKILDSLKGVVPPKPPEPQKVSTPHLPALRPIQSGGYLDMLAQLGIGPQQAFPGLKLPSTLGQALLKG